MKKKTVYVVLSLSFIIKIYQKKKSAYDCASRLQRANLHYPPSHYSVEEHKLI